MASSNIGDSVLVVAVALLYSPVALYSEKLIFNPFSSSIPEYFLVAISVVLIIIEIPFGRYVIHEVPMNSPLDMILHCNTLAIIFVVLLGVIFGDIHSTSLSDISVGMKGLPWLVLYLAISTLVR